MFFSLIFLPVLTGGYLKTHDFLQPLERVGKTCAKEEALVEISTSEKPPPPAPPPVEHVLPGGIGTYSISHISYFNQIQSRVPKPEGMVYPAAQASSTDRNDENSNSSSFTGSGFTLWEEPAVKKGKTGKENMTVDKPGVVGKIVLYIIQICDKQVKIRRQLTIVRRQVLFCPIYSLSLGLVWVSMPTCHRALVTTYAIFSC